MRLGPRALMRRVLGILIGMVGCRWSRLKKRYKLARIRLYLVMQWPLPSDLQSPYLLRIYAKAASRYHPEPYPGRVLLIEGEHISRRREIHWKELVSVELEVFRISVGHMDLVKEPAIGSIAGRIKAVLARAQGR